MSEEAPAIYTFPVPKHLTLDMKMTK